MSNLDVLLASNGDQTAGLAQTSSDGQSACFESNAALEASDTNQVSDVWRFDVATSSLARQSLATSAVASHFGNDATNLTDVGPNASRVFGLTLARDLDTASFAAPPSFAQQLAEIEPTTAQIQLRPRNVSGALPTADVYSARQSTDGNWLVFDTLADNLSALDANTTTDVYRMNLATGVLNLVSLNTAGLGSGSATSSGSALGISGTGARVAFLSDAGNLIANDSNSATDAFVWDANPSVPMRRVSVATAGGQANGASSEVSMDASGNYVVFTSVADNLVADDTNGVADVFLHTISTNTTRRISLGSSGTQLSERASSPTISSDGLQIAYFVNETSPSPGLYLHDRITQARSAIRPPGSVRAYEFSLHFGRDPRYLSYIGWIVGTDYAYRYDRFSISPNIELARTSTTDFLTPMISELRLASATQAILATDQPLSDLDRNSALDLLMVTLEPGQISFPSATISVSESAGSVDLAVRRLNGSEGFVNVGSSAVPGTALPSDFRLLESNALWEHQISGIQNLRLSLINDRQREGDETFTVNLINPGGGATLGTPASITVTITDDQAVDLFFTDGFE